MPESVKSLSSSGGDFPIFVPLSTAKKSLTGTSESDGPISNSVCLRLMSDRNFHYKINGAATVSDVPVPAWMPEYVMINSGDTVHFIKATGETDGDMWITRMESS